MTALSIGFCAAEFQVPVHTHLVRQVEVVYLAAVLLIWIHHICCVEEPPTCRAPTLTVCVYLNALQWKSKAEMSHVLL